jgi:CheY-like chemotaxis protein
MMSLKKILIADDEDEMREELSIILKDEGYDVCTAGDGKAALKLITKQKFDLLLLDLKMPILNGFEVLEALHESKVKIKTIVLTGSILGSSLPDAEDMSYTEKSRILKFADTVMNKPFDIPKLLGNIRQYTSKK